MRSAWRKIGVFSLSGRQLNSKEWRGVRTQVSSTCSTDVISDSNALSRIAIVTMSIYDRIENESVNFVKDISLPGEALVAPHWISVRPLYSFGFFFHTFVYFRVASITITSRFPSELGTIRTATSS